MVDGWCPPKSSSFMNPISISVSFSLCVATRMRNISVAHVSRGVDSKETKLNFVVLEMRAVLLSLTAF